MPADLGVLTAERRQRIVRGWTLPSVIKVCRTARLLGMITSLSAHLRSSLRRVLPGWAKTQ